MTYKIVVTKQGYDALTETNLNNYIFHSEYNTFKIVASGQTSFTIGSGVTGSDKTITHGLSYTPLAFAFAQVGTYTAFPNNPIGVTYADLNVTFDAVQSDSTKVHFILSNNSGGSKTFNISYYLFEVPLA